MTTRFEDVFELCSIASSLHLPELPALKETSQVIHDLSIKVPMTFYGINVPEQNHIVYDLLHQQYDAFELGLQKSIDQNIHMPYGTLSADRTFIPSMHRSTITNKPWNNFTLMEIVYMLGDFTAYQLMKKYGRTDAHIIGDWSTTYLKHAVNLLEKCGEYKKKEKIVAARPAYSQIN